SICIQSSIALQSRGHGFGHFGSFTSFPTSRHARFAPTADIRPMPAFMLVSASGEVLAETRKGFVRRWPAIQPLLDYQDPGFYWLRLPASVVVRHRISVKSHSSRERQRRCRQGENQRSHGLLCTPRLPHRDRSWCSSSYWGCPMVYRVGVKEKPRVGAGLRWTE